MAGLLIDRGKINKRMTQMPTRQKSNSSKRSSSGTKGEKKVSKVMGEFKSGTLKSSSGKKVKSRKQAIAIALNEARSSGAKIPPKNSSMSSK